MRCSGEVSSRIMRIWCYVRSGVWYYTTGDPRPLAYRSRWKRFFVIARLERIRARIFRGGSFSCLGEYVKVRATHRYGVMCDVGG